MKYEGIFELKVINYMALKKIKGMVEWWKDEKWAEVIKIKFNLIN